MMLMEIRSLDFDPDLLDATRLVDMVVLMMEDLGCTEGKNMKMSTGALE